MFKEDGGDWYVVPAVDLDDAEQPPIADHANTGTIGIGADPEKPELQKVPTLPIQPRWRPWRRSKPRTPAA